MTLITRIFALIFCLSFASAANAVTSTAFTPTNDVWVDHDGNILYKLPHKLVSLTGEIAPSVKTYEKYPYVRLVQLENGEWKLEPVDLGEFSLVQDLLTKIGNRLMGDFDGDGLSDLLIQTKLGHEILVSRNTAKNYKIGVNLSGGKYTVKDVNADQRADLLDASSGEVHYAQQTGLSHAIDVNDYVGSLAAESNISPSGEFTYTIPITMSESTGGFKPEFSFNYTSGGRNGPLSVGWSVSGLDSVIRCEKNMEIDGESTKVNFSADDRFCMNGQRLLVKSGHAYGGNNSEYRLQQDDGQKIIAHTSSSTTGPNGFTVYDTEGNKYYFGKYGSALDAVIKTTDGKHFAWALKRVEDASGNYYQYQYEQQSGTLEYRVKAINYSGNGTSRTHNKLVFEWEARNDTSKVAYIHGQKNTLTKRLKSLKTYYSNRLVREYKLTYQYEHYLLGNTSASKLVSVQACNGQNKCLSPTVFNWTQRRLGTSHLGNEIVKKFSNNSRYKAHKLLDFNGDGLMDIAYVRNDQASSTDHLFMIPNRVRGLGNETKLGDKASKSFRRSWKITDYDRDGKDDILYIDGYNQWRLVQYQSPGNFSDTVVSGSQKVTTNSNSRFVDITGDGYKDLLHVVNGKLVVQKGLRAGGVSPAVTNISYEFNQPHNTRVSPIDYDEDDNAYPTSDFNGDGRADFIVKVRRSTYTNPRPCGGTLSATVSSRPTPCPILPLTQDAKAADINLQTAAWNEQIVPTPASALTKVDAVYIAAEPQTQSINSNAQPQVQNTSASTRYEWRIVTSDGHATFKEFANLGNADTQKHITSADVNGDGLSDIIFKTENHGQRWFARINTGYGFSSPILITTKNERNFIKFVDINNDGAQEVYVESYGDLFYFFNGTGFTARRYNNLSSTYGQTDWIDLSGDGVPDRLIFGGRSFLRFSNDPGEPRIVKVTNGFGADTDIQYSTLIDSTVYTKETDANQHKWGNYGRVQDLKGAMRVVKRFTKDQETLTYHYRGGKAQVGRGLLGYRQIEIESNRAKTRVVTTYRQDSIYRGSVIATETYIKQASDDTNNPPPPPPPEPCDVNPIACECGIQPLTTKMAPVVLPCNDLRSLATSDVTVIDSGSALSGASFNLASASAASNGWVLKSATHTQYAKKEQNSFKIANLTKATRVYPYKTTTKTYNTDTNIGEVLATQTKEIAIDDYGNIELKTVAIGSPWGSSREVTDAVFSYQAYGGRKDNETVTKTYTNKKNGHFISSDTKSFFTDYGYDAKGRLISKRDDNGVLTEYLRHPTYGLVQTERTLKAGMPTRSTTYTFDSTYRHVIGQTNSLGHNSRTVYDSLGRKDHVESANGQRTYSEYNHMGRLIAEIQTPANSISKTSSAAISKSMSQYWCQQVSHCPTGAVYFEETIAEGKPDARVYYDAYGRELRKSSAGLVSNTWINVDTFYDAYGRKTGETVPHFSNNNSPERSFIEYDTQNRVTKIIKPDGSEWTSEYAGLAVTSINPNNARNTQLKNALGLLVQVTDANGNNADYEYDANAKATKLAGQTVIQSECNMINTATNVF